MTSRTDRSIPELFSDAVGQLAKLIGNEFALARAELSEKAGQAGRAAAMMGAVADDIAKLKYCISWPPSSLLASCSKRVL